ncbi:MAG TPA: nitrilase-related carbon-nitrogen hydrolase, partial [Dehalococcoidia bacterium]|nr:nitrilase-related carbon-nitrogen hydrolase [Dehalococcoidia bacterium]
MTLAKYAMYARGEQIHASVWPAWKSQRDHIAFGTRQYAFEGRAFVIVACGLIDGASIPEAWRETRLDHGGQLADGGSAIIGPNGEYLAGPLYEREDILYADIDLAAIALAKRTLDTSGHYSRPDVLRLQFDATEHSNLVESTFPHFDGPDAIEPAQGLARPD